MTALTIVSRPRRSLVLLFVLLPALAVAQSSLDSYSDLVANRAYMYDLSTLYSRQQNIAINQTISTATEAIAAVSEGRVDMASISRNLRQGDSVERMATAIPVAWDALTVIVHPDNPINNISLEQLYDLYTGQITNWSSFGIDPGPITLVTQQGEAAGPDYNLREILLGSTSIPLSSTLQVADSEAVIAEVEKNLQAMAVMNYSTIRLRSIRLLALNQIPVSPQTIQSGDYLLAVPLYLVVRDDGRNSRDVRRLVRFFSSSSAKNVMRRNGVTPYSDAIGLSSVALDRSRIMQQVRRRTQ